MLTISQIKEPVEKEMHLFEDKFKSSMKSNVPLLDKITHYIIKRKGKQLRPLFIFLSAKACGDISEATYTAASLIELLHTATLVHDDVVDEANERRGFFSINYLWKNKIAVLVGDYLLSRGLLLAVDNNQFQLLKIVSTAVREMSEGELLQIEKARRLDIDEKIYFDIIRQKTASLIAACCAAGAASSVNDESTIAIMRNFGEKTGIAFQIKDDLFDYESDNSIIGKPTGIDIKERKMTLPLIYALNNASFLQKRKIINIIKNHNTEKDKVKDVLSFVNQSGGIEYAKQKMEEYRIESVNLLNKLTDSPARNSLEQLVWYTINRKH